MIKGKVTSTKKATTSVLSKARIVGKYRVGLVAGEDRVGMVAGEDRVGTSTKGALDSPVIGVVIGASVVTGVCRLIVALLDKRG